MAREAALLALAKLNDASPRMTGNQLAKELSRLAVVFFALDDKREPEKKSWQCSRCDRTFDDAQWQCLTLRGFVGAGRVGSRLAVAELRDCVCGNVLGRESWAPMAREVRT